MGFKHRRSIYGADHRTTPYWSRQAIILNHIAPITITGDGKTDTEWSPSRSRKNRYSNLKDSKPQARCDLRHSLQNLAFHMQKNRSFYPYRRAGDNSVLHNPPHQQRSPESQINDAKVSASSKIALLRRTSGVRATAAVKSPLPRARDSWVAHTIVKTLGSACLPAPWNPLAEREVGNYVHIVCPPS